MRALFNAFRKSMRGPTKCAKDVLHTGCRYSLKPLLLPNLRKGAAGRDSGQNLKYVK